MMMKSMRNTLFHLFLISYIKLKEKSNPRGTFNLDAKTGSDRTSLYAIHACINSYEDKAYCLVLYLPIKNFASLPY